MGTTHCAVVYMLLQDLFDCRLKGALRLSICCSCTSCDCLRLPPFNHRWSLGCCMPQRVLPVQWMHVILSEANNPAAAGCWDPQASCLCWCRISALP